MIPIYSQRSVLTTLILLFGLAGLVSAQQKGWYKDGVDQIMASPLLVDLNQDGRMEIAIPSFNDKLYVYSHDGTTFNPGGNLWPKTLGFGDGSIATVAAGDVDGGGDLELVVLGDNTTGKNATVKVYKADGAELASLVLSANASGKATPCLINCYRYNGSTPDPRKEIVIRDGDGRVHILRWNGTALVELDNASYFNTSQTNMDRLGSQPITPSVSAVDLGNDVTYVVAASTDNNICRWEITSTAANNWSVNQLSTLNGDVSAGRFLSSPTLADLDGDGSYELVAGYSKGNVYCWNQNGSLRAGWPQPTTQAVISSPAVADLDGNGDLEIIAGCYDGAIYAWDHQGNSVAGTPLLTGGDIFASPMVAELDGQNGLEIVAASLDGFVYIWNNQGQLLPYWPKRIKTPLYSSPAVGAIHGGNRMSVVCSDFDGRLFVFDLAPLSLDPAGGWRQFRGGPERMGSY